MNQLQKELENFSQQLQQASDNIQINTAAEKLVTSSIDAEFSSIWFYDESRFVLLRERDPSHLRELSLEHKKGIIYKCFMTKESKRYNYLASDKDYVAEIDNPDNIKIKSKIMLPLMDGKKLIGIVTAYNSIKKNKKFVKDDVETLKKISTYVMAAIRKMHMQKEHTQIQPQNIDNDSDTKQETTDETLTFVANFVHDIRTPANSLYGFLDLLEDQITDERLKTYLLNAKESANFITELTTSVLNMVATHKESSVSDVKEVDSIKFFSSVAKSFASNMYAKGISFNIYIDPLMPKSIKIDTLKMKRVILNLIGNAYKFTPNNKAIEFSVRYVAKTNRISIYVKDTGIGIPKEKQSQIFEAFKQAEDTTALNFGGTGLGLFISAKYVKELGGTLALISEVDKGSTFSFDIPANIIDPTASYEPINNKNINIALVMDPEHNFSANNIARHIVRMGIDKTNIKAINSLNEIENTTTHLIIFQSKIDAQLLKAISQKGIKVIIVEEEFLSIDKNNISDNCDIISKYGYIANKLYQFVSVQKTPRVLVVDDDSISVLLIQTILENEFCEIEVANNGKVALDMMLQSHKESNPYAIVYIDNNMPVMNGLETIQKLRQFEKEHKSEPIYTVSTSADQSHSPQESELFNDFVGKPFSKEDIRKALYKQIK